MSGTARRCISVPECLCVCVSVYQCFGVFNCHSVGVYTCMYQFAGVSVYLIVAGLAFLGNYDTVCQCDGVTVRLCDSVSVRHGVSVLVVYVYLCVVVLV